MTTEAIIEKVNQTLIEGFELTSEQLKPDSNLFEDLGLDSLDAIDMIVQLEEKFDTKVSDEKAKSIRTMNDVYSLVTELALNSGAYGSA